MPNGYNTICGERGNNFSGEQRQRIIIARAFLKQAPILILDEANYNTGLMTAASGGHESIVRLMLELRATNYNHSMVAAAHRGHIEIVRLMLANDSGR